MLAVRPTLLRLAFAVLVGGVDVASASTAPIRVALDPPEGRTAGEPWTSWLQTALGSVYTISPDYPVDRLNVRLRAADSGGAVVFGRVRRGTVPGLEFYVDPDAHLDALNADWRGFHEAAHLLIPFPGNRDIWFTEGLASYYQYLLQARAGVISGEEAWTQLARGFGRGVNDPTGADRTLRSLSPRMWRLNAYRRVYWTGAAFFLNVDVRLRTETNGRHSLDSTLAAFHRCCLDARSRWDARSLIEQFGSLSVPAIWREEYQRIIDAPASPAFQYAFQALGIRSDGWNVSLSRDRRGAQLRDAIASPGSAGTARLVVDLHDHD